MGQEGRFLAFIYLYGNLHHREPAQLDLLQYFRVTPPSVHSTIVNLEQPGLIAKYLLTKWRNRVILGVSLYTAQRTRKWVRMANQSNVRSSNSLMVRQRWFHVTALCNLHHIRSFA